MVDIRKDDQAFSGIEAAIVLIAFIAVAVIFSYVFMGLGQNAAESARDQTLSGIDTIAFAPDGVKGLDTMGTGESIDLIKFWMYGGNSSIDMTNVSMDFITKDEIYTISAAGTDWNRVYREGKVPNPGEWLVTTYVGDGDQLLEKGERMEIAVMLAGKNRGVLPSEDFTLRMMTAEGIAHIISGRAPAYIDPVNQISLL
ncbi:MAG: hypothetical protein EF806_05425 [Candidatus Methanoliparum thermophilum]|uniref:Flagellin n=1 Tax=Methanoliparum thermophilum TaxID=2491083 RepID=A0A520KS68_METT2|nr:flagellin [Candidatus Methanoliparum sp. LAM-1]RZN64062.1 MAG: hypothetical protein EF806_05425 [Candidatus Methanoliparum thermophilum]BDC35682.1 hypothetical protein MTLP_03640 [Candidatus Methanoliparum sp. LAM-1]